MAIEGEIYPTYFFFSCAKETSSNVSCWIISFRSRSLVCSRKPGFSLRCMNNANVKEMTPTFAIANNSSNPVQTRAVSSTSCLQPSSFKLLACFTHDPSDPRILHLHSLIFSAARDVPHKYAICSNTSTSAVDQDSRDLSRRTTAV